MSKRCDLMAPGRIPAISGQNAEEIPRDAQRCPPHHPPFIHKQPPSGNTDSLPHRSNAHAVRAFILPLQTPRPSPPLPSTRSAQLDYALDPIRSCVFPLPQHGDITIPNSESCGTSIRNSPGLRNSTSTITPLLGAICYLPSRRKTITAIRSSSGLPSGP